MQLTIVPADSTVIVDGQRRVVNCASLASCNGLSAVQWDGTTGHKEFAPVAGVYAPNETISSIAAFADVIAAWNAAPPPPGATTPP